MTSSIILAEVLLVLLTAIYPSVHIPSPFAPRTLTNDGLRATPSFSAGVLLMAAGASIRASCYAHLGSLFTFELAIKRGHRLITSGPYAVVRHPGYTGGMLVYAGICWSQFGPSSWLATSGLWQSTLGRAAALGYMLFAFSMSLALVRRVPEEDRMMKEQFPSEWVEWAKRTPYRFVPFVY